MSQKISGLTVRVHDSRNIFKLTLDGIVGTIATFPATAPVNRIHAKVFLKRRENGRPRDWICSARTGNQDQG
jgi:hypothetical protein